MKFKIRSVDQEPDDLPKQLPLRGRLLRTIAGPPRRPVYWLAELTNTVTWTQEGATRAIRHLVLTPRWQGSVIGPGAKLPVNIWYVIDDSVLKLDAFESMHAVFVAIGTVKVSGSLSSRIRAIFQRTTMIVLAALVTAVSTACSALEPASRPAQSGNSDDAFPRDGWETASSVDTLGWSAERTAALKTTVDAAGSSAFMLVTSGKVVASWGDTSRTFWTHSVRKSYMSALVGMAVADGKIDTSRTLAELGINEKATPLTASEQQARVIDLLQARSGVYIAAAGEVDAMRDARPKRGSHAPGTFWYYNNWDFNVLGTVFRKTTGEDIFEAIDRRIARPTGMQDYRAAEGMYGLEGDSEHAVYAFRVSARDLARFGLLYLHRGKWRDRQLIPASWVDASIRSYSATGDQGSLATKSGYGYMWWVQTNAKTHPQFGIPDGTFTASGNGGQRLTVIPQFDTVIVNLMNTDEAGPRLNSSQWDALVADVLKARVK